MTLRIKLLVATLLLPLVSLGLLTLGCNPAPRAEHEERQPARVEIDLHLAVVDDPNLAAAITQLRADWRARTGASIELRELSSGELRSADSLSAGGKVDALIYPSGQLGTLVERGWL